MSSPSIYPQFDLDALERDGWYILRGVFSEAQVRTLLEELETALARCRAEDPAIRSGEGTVYAARNVLRIWPTAPARSLVPVLREALTRVLGTAGGLVRGLYFDKPPGNSWALPWHKDLTIAVRDHERTPSLFTKPTRKAGVPHVEASEELLHGMVTARIHLDAVNDENGPLRVLSGSHRTGKVLRLDDGVVVAIHAEPGDVLLMRPLVAHASNRSTEGTTRHRRILHLEFAAHPTPGEGYEWYEFIPFGP